jgi:hypothetical protein
MTPTTASQLKSWPTQIIIDLVEHSRSQLPNGSPAVTRFLTGFIAEAEKELTSRGHRSA